MLQEVLIPSEFPESSTKSMSGVNVPVNTEVIDMDDDGQSASSHPMERRTKTTCFGVRGFDEDIPLLRSKRQKTAS